MLKKFIAECIGTFVLVFFACGVAALTGDLVATALAFGLVIVAMAFSIGRISGCHINPAVSLACLITKRMTLKEFLVYVCAQIVGAVVGGILLFGILSIAHYDLKATADTIKTIGNASNATLNGKQNAAGIISSILVEIILTFVFVYVILNVTDEKSGTAKIAGIVIGLTLTLVHLLGISLTGTSVNPARSIGTAVGSVIFGGNKEALKQVWIFIVAPLAGGALASVVFNVLHTDENSSAE